MHAFWTSLMAQNTPSSAITCVHGVTLVSSTCDGGKPPKQLLLSNLATRRQGVGPTPAQLMGGVAGRQRREQAHNIESETGCSEHTHPQPAPDKHDPLCTDSSTGRWSCGLMQERPARMVRVSGRASTNRPMQLSFARTTKGWSLPRKGAKGR